MKKKLTYMLAVTSDYMFAAGNIVLSLIKQRPQKDFDITIFYDEMLPSDKKIFQNTGICNLIQYIPPKGFENKIRKFCPKFNDEKFAKHFSFLKFAKFEIFELLKKYKYAVWLDADISVQADPGEIINYEPFAITVDKGWTVQNNFIQPIFGYDMERQGVCSAVFLVSDKLKKYSEMREWCYKTAIKVCPYFKNIDQGIFNLLLQEFNIDYNLLPLEDFQCVPKNEDAFKAKIVHFGTKNKIWNTSELVSSFPEWYRIHLEWLKQGGSDFIYPDGYAISNIFLDNMRLRETENHLRDELKNLKGKINVLGINNNQDECQQQNKNYVLKLLGIPVYKRIAEKNKVRRSLLGRYFFSVVVKK